MRSFPHPINVLITGASRGIGFALVRALKADPGVDRLFAAARRASVDDALFELIHVDGGRLSALDMDVTIEDSVEAGAAAIRANVARLDLIVNCVGLLHDGATMQPEKRLVDVRPGNLQRSFAVNAIGPLLVAKHFQRLLDSEARAVFASLSARVGSISDNRLGGWYAYRASKAAQNMVIRNLSIELRRRARGVICVALHPGTVDTGLSRPFQSRVPREQLLSPDRSARHLLDVIDALRAADNGSFFAWDGQVIPW